MMTTSTRPAARRVALVSGGTRGIGLGIARALAQEGWHLGLCGRRGRDEVSSTLAELAGHGVEVHYTRADVADTHARARFVTDALDMGGF